MRDAQKATTAAHLRWQAESLQVDRHSMAVGQHAEGRCGIVDVDSRCGQHRLCPVGEYRTWRNCVHQNPIGRQGAGKVLGERQQRGFRRGIAHESRRLVLNRHRCHVDDPRPVGRAQQRQRGPHAADSRRHPLVEGRGPVGVGEIVESSRAGWPGRVDQDVQYTPSASHLVENSRDVGRRGQICWQPKHLGATGISRGVDSGSQPGRVPTDDADPAAFASKTQCGGEPDAASTAGDRRR
jgi:hypothetical protein